jgi:16S rRNA (uracil1498-N3)-methyltransferase
MNLFYQREITGNTIPDLIELDAEESYHCVRVLRMKTGSRIHVTDGRGNLFNGVLVNEDSKRCAVSLEAVTSSEKSPVHLHMAVAPTKNIDRFEWFLEKATEIGMQEITPLICEHSERTSIRPDRLHKILVSAMKQSLNLHIPKLNEAVKFSDFVTNTYSGQKFIGYVEEKQEILLKNAYRVGSDSVILIGPEGDFSKGEVLAAVKNGYTTISLGDSRLRTETAAMVAVHTINLLNQPNTAI